MEQNKPEYHVVSLSGGKDSTAMLLMMLEKGMPVDDILFCDTGLEFPGLYAHLDKVEQYIGRPITRIQAPVSYTHLGWKRLDSKVRIPLYGPQYVFVPKECS